MLNNFSYAHNILSSVKKLLHSILWNTVFINKEIGILIQICIDLIFFLIFGSLSIVGVGILKIPALNSFYEHFSVI